MTEILLSISYVLLLAGTFLAIGRFSVPARERLPLQSARDLAQTIRRGVWTVYQVGAAHTYPVKVETRRDLTPAN